MKQTGERSCKLQSLQRGTGGKRGKPERKSSDSRRKHRQNLCGASCVCFCVLVVLEPLLGSERSGTFLLRCTIPPRDPGNASARNVTKAQEPQPQRCKEGAEMILVLGGVKFYSLFIPLFLAPKVKRKLMFWTRYRQSTIKWWGATKSSG